MPWKAGGLREGIQLAQHSRAPGVPVLLLDGGLCAIFLSVSLSLCLFLTRMQKSLGKKPSMRSIWEKKTRWVTVTAQTEATAGLLRWHNPQGSSSALPYSLPTSCCCPQKRNWTIPLHNGRGQACSKWVWAEKHSSLWSIPLIALMAWCCVHSLRRYGTSWTSV